MVLTLAAAVLLLWAGLFAAMRGWRARYDALAAHGRAAVAPAVNPLAAARPPASTRPPGGAVADTHAMLVALTAASLLDRDQMDALAADLRARVALARPETAVADLSRIWDDLEARAGPAIAPSAETPLPARATPPASPARRARPCWRGSPPRRGERIRGEMRYCRLASMIGPSVGICTRIRHAPRTPPCVATCP